LLCHAAHCLRRAASLLGHIRQYAPPRRLARRFALHPHGFAKRVVLAPCSVVRSVEYDSTLLRSLPSQNATSAQTASQKAYVVSMGRSFAATETTTGIRCSHTVVASGSPASAQGASEAFPEPAWRRGGKKPSAPEH